MEEDDLPKKVFPPFPVIRSTVPRDHLVSRAISSALEQAE
jgi:hypothetical protein